MKNNLCFCIIEIDSVPAVKELERELIRFVSRYNKGKKICWSTNSLGANCNHKKVSKSGLWNYQHVII